MVYRVMEEIKMILCFFLEQVTISFISYVLLPVEDSVWHIMGKDTFINA